jgi:hypothetical protein
MKIACYNNKGDKYFIMIKILCENCETIFLSPKTNDIVCPWCENNLFLTSDLFPGHFVGHVLNKKVNLASGNVNHIHETSLKQTESYATNPKLINNLYQETHNKKFLNPLIKIKEIFDELPSIKLKQGSIQFLVGIVFFIFGLTLIGYNFYWIIGNTPYNYANADQEIFNSINTYLELDLPMLELSGPIRSDAGINFKNNEDFRSTNKRALLGEGEMVMLPSKGEVSSGYGYRRSPFNDRKEFHTGIDLPRPYGSKIKAAVSGKVIFSGTQNGYGKVVILEHANGYQTIYGHNSKNLVNKGDYVKQNDIIAQVGDTGRTTGPHLHFELRKNNKYLDPEKYIKFKKFL